jgi:hypothetical protein
MLKLVSKFAMDILPSVAATIIGAYIVNHYINIRPDSTKLDAAAAVSSVQPKKADPKSDSKPAEKSADLGNIPEPGVRAKGISEKGISEKALSEKVIIEKSAVEKPVEKPADKPAETASIPADTRRHQSAPREKAAARTVPAPVPAAEPVVAAPNTVPPVEAATAPEERRDANDLARAAIERLRGTSEGSPRAQEAARVPDAPRVVAAPAAPLPPVAVQSVQPLPPPILVSTPAAETFDGALGSSQAKPAYPSTARLDDPRRPTPPADIPDRPPLDLRADAVPPSPRERTSVAEDVLSAAKSVFHAVLPK